ncbi:unnamed protein product [Adineta steineri]|nr:unnamed protein product [Adineta steineri]CAF0784432.1 unnamed protein product [Adineta steineri]CAF0810630.1 unnamed protein product [Adineta steineri]CAF4077795.1 unnamed protein product [Adineta steineri]
MHQQAEEWRKNRKMVLQLVSVSFVCIVFNVPDVIDPLFRLTSGLQPIPANIQELILDYLGYGSCIFLPFACLSTIPHVKEKLKNVIDYRRWPGVMNNRRRAIVGIQTITVASRR